MKRRIVYLAVISLLALLWTAAAEAGQAQWLGYRTSGDTAKVMSGTPGQKIIGVNAATGVAVEVITGQATSAVPRMAAWVRAARPPRGAAATF